MRRQTSIELLRHEASGVAVALLANDDNRLTTIFVHEFSRVLDIIEAYVAAPRT